MQSYQDNLLGRIGGVLAPLKGVSVTVTSDATGLPATLYSDNGVTALPQPLVTDDQGLFSFYAADGSYTLAYSGPSVVASTRRIALDDPKDNPYATLAQLAAPSAAGIIGYTRATDGAVMTMANALDNATYQNDTTVRGALLTGLSLASSAAVTAADTVLGAFGKHAAQLASKDASGGYAGLTGYQINFKNAANTFTSLLTNANTATRTYTFPDKDMTVAGMSDVAITKYVQTIDQTITGGSSLTIAHGLGTTPKIMLGFLKCVTASNGYSVGDITPALFDVANSRGAAITFDATNLYVRYGTGGSTFLILDKGTGGVVLITNANWAFFIRALA